MSHKSGVAGKDVYLYAGVMTEAHQATTYCLMTLHRPTATPHTLITTTLGLLFQSEVILDEGAGFT